jgi:hypothetical protein
VGRELAGEELYDFLLFSLPDNDHHSHRFGPEATEDSIAHADRSFSALVEAAGGIDRFLDDHAVILLADHSQTSVEHEVRLIDALAGRWRVLQPAGEPGPPPELAVSPGARAGSVCVLAEGRRFASVHAGARQTLTELEGVDLTAWLVEDGAPLERHPERPWPPQAAEAAVVGDGSEFRFRPGSQVRDLRGQGWDIDGDPSVLDLRIDGDEADSPGYPDGLGRLWAALVAPQSGDILVSLTEGFECVDWGGASHAGGGSHGALAAGDSAGPLLACGLDGFAPDAKRQWTIADTSELVLGHFGLSADNQDRNRDVLTAAG